MSRPTVAVVGAGTAGLTAAWLLADEAHVTVYEARRDIGHRYVHSVQAIRNYDQPADVIDDLASHGIALPRALVHPLHRQLRVFPDGSHVTIESAGEPAFYALLRGTCAGSLDQHLLAELRDRCDVRCGEAVVPDALDADFVVSARGSARIDGPFRLVGVEFQGRSARYPADTVALLLDQDVTPGGYVALLPYPDAAGVQLSIVAGWDPAVRGDVQPQAILDHVTAHPLLGALLPDFALERRLGGSGACGFVNRPRGRTLFVGEELGALDCGLAYGNLSAFRSSIAAAQSIAASDPGGFLRRARALGVLDGIEEGVMRRLAMRRLTNADLVRESARLRAAVGERLSYARYERYKRGGAPKKWLGRLMARAVLRRWIAV